MADKSHTEIVKELIEICTESLDTAGSLTMRCECGKAVGKPIEMWSPIGISDTYCLRNTLQSLLDIGAIKD